MPSRPTIARLRTAALVALCAAWLLANTGAQAMSIRELRAVEKSDKQQGGNYKRYYLVGVMEGVLAAQEQGVRAGAMPTICLNGRRLLPSMAEELFQTEMRRNSDFYEADMPVALVMGNALATVYAC